jgi:hypothetical protein
MQHRAFYKTPWNTILDGRLWSGELLNLRKDGKIYSEEMQINPVRSKDGRITNFVAVKHDITLRKQAEAESAQATDMLVSINTELKEANEIIAKISRTDPLTGLANRRTFDERMISETARADRLGHGLCAIIGDLDHFKSINDEFGHLIGIRYLSPPLPSSPTSRVSTICLPGSEKKSSFSSWPRPRSLMRC